jgi:hypothetical protein
MAFLIAWLAFSALEDAPEPHYPEHLRLGIGVISGATELKSEAGDRMAPTLLGFDLRLGVRFNDSVALMVDGSVTAVVPQLSGGVLVEWTPFVFISGAIGAAVNWIPWVPNDGGSSDWAWGIGVPIRLAINAPIRDERGDSFRRREAIAFSFTATPGYSFASAVFQNEFQIGFMGGISFEMY